MESAMEGAPGSVSESAHYHPDLEFALLVCRWCVGYPCIWEHRLLYKHPYGKENGICVEYVLEYVWDMHGIGMEYVVGYACNMHGRCMEHAWNTWNMHGTCMKYAWHMIQYPYGIGEQGGPSSESCTPARTNHFYCVLGVF